MYYAHLCTLNAEKWNCEYMLKSRDTYASDRPFSNCAIFGWQVVQFHNSNSVQHSCNKITLSIKRDLGISFLFPCNSLQPSRGNRAQPIKVPAWHELKPFKWRRMSWIQNERELQIERWRKAEVREGQLFSVCCWYPLNKKTNTFHLSDVIQMKLWA